MIEMDNPTEEQKLELENFKNSQEFCAKLMTYFKLENKALGVNLKQALWVHHRMRSVAIVYDGLSLNIDLMNLVISGDLEVAYVTLASMTPDDGSEPYHWLTADRIDYIKNEIARYLGWV